MTDQLSLDLDDALPQPPDRLRPMLPRPAPAPFDSADHLFEPSWGGRRALAFLEPAVERGADDRWRTATGLPSLRLLDAGGVDVAGLVPELDELALRIEARSAVLDGEIVATTPTGRADTSGLEARLRGRPGPPLTYLAFDLLYLDGRPLLGQALERRREALRRILRPGPEIVAVPAIPGEGRALHDAVTAQGLAGILARQRTSPYLPGVRSRLWRSIAAGTTGAPAPEAGSADGDAAVGIATHGRGSILAVIRKLPLEDEP
jgi:bifunctional non-homologous end joining protein LigD